ncbi:hypothetical protein [Okeania sp. SIO2B9]|uniref:hypothetical protein n=1 Tax=Okeania sp. SIO2B9 TaxID=2607782 RepID=UPI00142CB58B|nr:hypothetical protein [Okeania sp. SIO2B9]NES91552.1 hypothetical protein [Okeania sp. SIO2B9]
MNQKQRLLILDLDNTIRQTISGNEFINDDPEDQELIKGTAQKIKEYKDAGYRIVGITNQKGVSLGYKTLDNCIKEQRFTLGLCPELERILFCPDDGDSLVIISREATFMINSKTFLNSNMIDEYKSLDSSIIKGFDSFRKPGIGAIQFLSLDRDICRDRSLFVGDMETDLQCAEKAKIKFLYPQEWLDKKVGDFV